MRILSSDDVWVAVGATVLLVALIVVVCLIALLVYRRYIRSLLVWLIAHREKIRASRHTLATILRYLVDESDEALLAFASDNDNDNRKALAEIANRMSITREELDMKRVPSVLLPATIELADCAHVVFDVAEWLNSGTSENEILHRLGVIDLKPVVQQCDLTDSILLALCDRFNIDDSVVYGGGLYL